MLSTSKLLLTNPVPLAPRPAPEPKPRGVEPLNLRAGGASKGSSAADRSESKGGLNDDQRADFAESLRKVREEKRTDRAEKGDSRKSESEEEDEKEARAGEAVEGVDGGDGQGAGESRQGLGVEAESAVGLDDQTPDARKAQGASSESGASPNALNDAAAQRGVASGVVLRSESLDVPAKPSVQTSGDTEAKSRAAKVASDSVAQVRNGAAGEVAGGVESESQARSAEDSGRGVTPEKGRAEVVEAKHPRASAASLAQEQSKATGADGKFAGSAGRVEADHLSKIHPLESRTLNNENRAKDQANSGANQQGAAKIAESQGSRDASDVRKPEQVSPARPVVNAQELESKSDWTFVGERGASSQSDPASAQGASSRNPPSASGSQQRSEVGGSVTSEGAASGRGVGEAAQSSDGSSQKSGSEGGLQQKDAAQIARRADVNNVQRASSSQEKAAPVVVSSSAVRQSRADSELNPVGDRGLKVSLAGAEGGKSAPDLAGGLNTAQARGVSVVMGRTGEPALETFAGTAQRAGGRMPNTEAQFERVMAAQVERGVIAAMNAQSGQVTIRLHPASLGQMRVHVKMEQGGVNAKFEASSARAKDLIAKGVSGLRESLGERGIELNRVVVAISDEDPAGGEAGTFSQDFQTGGESPAHGTPVADTSRRSARSAPGEPGGAPSRLSPNAMLEALAARRSTLAAAAV